MKEDLMMKRKYSMLMKLRMIMNEIFNLSFIYTF